MQLASAACPTKAPCVPPCVAPSLEQQGINPSRWPNQAATCPYPPRVRLVRQAVTSCRLLMMLPPLIRMHPSCDTLWHAYCPQHRYPPAPSSPMSISLVFPLPELTINSPLKALSCLARRSRSNLVPWRCFRICRTGLSLVGATPPPILTFW
jgi:hypothetical protein